MKDIRFNISLYIIIPVIFSGIAALSIIVSYRIASYYIPKGLDPLYPLLFWGMLIILFTFISGLLIVKFIIDPIKRFVLQTQNLGVVKKLNKDNDPDPAKGDMGHIQSIFEQVSELLGNVEARELFPDIIGRSRSIRGILNQILKVAPKNSTVLLLGETGTGKELIAKSIHQHSNRQDKSFVAINCAAIPDTLLESELFGHEKGAFTGANSRKPGKFEMADHGTLFLDEIGDMPLETQAKVLRVIQENRIERVGGVTPVKVDVRFIAATNKDLPKMVEDGRFRNDLFFRLNVFSIFIPALRARREDIPLLAEAFLRKKDPELELTSESLQVMMAYDWPGNVRELQNAIEASSVLAEKQVKPSHLPASIHKGAGMPSVSGANGKFEKGADADSLFLNKNQDIDARIQNIEKGIIIEALNRTNGVQVKAAALLGIKERSLWHRIKKFQIDASIFKKPKDTT